jgi:serine/threonine protein kinase
MQEEKHFEEEELWYLLLTLVEAAEIAHQLDSRLGDVKPSNLLLNKQGQIKMLTRFSLPTFLDSFSQESPKGSLFSPEELESRRKAFKLNKNNYILCESFSIGMTMLAAGALSKVSLLYNY